ncbi:hypothetical protein HMPREF0185_01614 [Brevundimonas diminuta 470-4]|nr:hypothetical protein HMPREF0185_01614 [Brevundimonas diminuta 470-4]
MAFKNSGSAYFSKRPFRLLLPDLGDCIAGSTPMRAPSTGLAERLARSRRLLRPDLEDLEPGRRLQPAHLLQRLAPGDSALRNPQPLHWEEGAPGPASSRAAQCEGVSDDPRVEADWLLRTGQLRHPEYAGDGRRPLRTLPSAGQGRVDGPGSEPRLGGGLGEWKEPDARDVF